MRYFVFSIFLFILSGCSNLNKDSCLDENGITLKIDKKEINKTNNEKIENDACNNVEETNLSDEDIYDEDCIEDENLFDELDKFSPKEVDFSKADPLEKMNRVLYGVHRGVDLIFVRPLALTYSRALPNPIRKGLTNFLNNLTAPLRMFCWLLQGNVEEAGKSAGKFVVNTFLGIGGVFDTASKLGIKDNKTGFAETFKKWKVEHGPYIVVPGIGPASMRTAFGMLFDSFLDPVFLLTLNKGLPYNENNKLTWYSTAAQVTSLLITRANVDDIYEDVEKNSVNRYSKLRSLVLQQSINR